MVMGLFQVVFPQENKKIAETVKLKCDVLVKDTDFVYGLNIYPSDKIKDLFNWEGMVQNLKTVEILTIFRASTMRGQNNVYERMLRPDGDVIKITASIDIEKLRINYHIQRIRGKHLIFSYKGQKEIFSGT